MDIKLDEFHTYLHCPLKQKFQFVDGIQMPSSLSVEFKKAVHKTILYFFHCASNGWVPKPAQMKDKWAQHWEEASGNTVSGIADLLVTSQSLHSSRHSMKSPEHEKLKRLGFEMVHNFYHYNKDNPGNIIGVDMDYRIPIGNLTILGKFELIREIVDAEDGKRYIEIVDFKTNADHIDPFLVKNDFNLTVASYAFRNLFQSKEDRVKYHYLKTGRDIIIQKTEQDFKRMKSIIDGVYIGIQNKLHYPRQTHMCKTCEHKELCDKVRF
jgi:CRISPR/Cas system-associated exonuclease Cas4 (RecB family)